MRELFNRRLFAEARLVTMALFRRRSDLPISFGFGRLDPAGEAKLVVSPAGLVFDVGPSFAFGAFTLGGKQVSDADIALYIASGPDAPARGPFPARVDSLKAPPAFRAKTTADDPSAATTVYVVPRIHAGLS